MNENEIERFGATGDSPLAESAPAEFDLLAEWSRNLRPATRRTYAGVLAKFAAFCECDQREAVDRLMRLPAPQAYALVNQWRESMEQGGAAVRSMRLRLSALKGLVSQANALGLVPWTLKLVKLPPDDNAPMPVGISDKLFLRYWRAAEHGPNPERDLCLLAWLRTMADRRGAIVGITLSDVDRATHVVTLTLKGGRAKSATIPPLLWARVEAWLRVRGDAPGPMFGLAFDHQVRTVLRMLARIANVEEVGPHRFRRTAITVICEKRDVATGQILADHRSINTTHGYNTAARRLADAAREFMDEDTARVIRGV